MKEAVHRILLIEDSPLQARLIHQYLALRGYQITSVHSGEDALPLLSQTDVVVLDLILPGLQGLEVLFHIRKHQIRVKVLILSQKSSLEERVPGLRQGADDYLGKPYDLTELEARLEALWRRHQKERTIHFGPLVVVPGQFQVHTPSGPVEVLRQEMQILLRLLDTPGETVSRSELLEVLSTVGEHPGERLVDVRIFSLRKKLGERWIETVRGEGYRLNPVDLKAEPVLS